jgi:starch phosphorylase
MSIHQENKQKLVDYIKNKNGVSLNADKLIIGFSRRAAPYKRSDFIFSSPEIIGPYLENQDIQIVFSGKAHPFDDKGKGIVTNLVEISKKYPNSVVFLENYGMEIGSVLTRGADVWLNNPRRPLEASGTSGMKASMNGVLNFSILDGWWPEACNHGVNGWQFGDGFESDDDEQDKHDLEALYRTLINEVMPTFYNDKAKWQQMMRASILDTCEYFAVKRMLDEYYNKMYKL